MEAYPQCTKNKKWLQWWCTVRRRRNRYRGY